MFLFYCCSLDSSDLTCYIHSVSPVKKSGPTSFFNCNHQTEQRDDIVKNRKTTPTPTTADFQYQAQDDVMSVASLTNVAPAKLVAVKGYLQHLGRTKTIVIQGSPMRKQEGYIVNATEYIKIIFGSNHADAVTPQSNYFFNKVRVKVSQNQRYLNTP